MASGAVKVIIVLIVFLVAALAGTVTGIVRFVEHRTLPDAFLYGGGAFVAVAGLLLTGLQAANAFPA